MAEATTAEKRSWLKANGHDVGDRGKLSAEAEAAYAAGNGGSTESPTTVSGVPADPNVA